MNRVVVDSSVFLSALIEQEPRRLETLLFFKKLGGTKESVYLPSLVIAEILNRLQKLGGENRIEIVYRFLMSFTVINLDEAFLQQSLPYWNKCRLKTSDAIIAITSAIYDTVLVGWDEKLVAEAGKITKAITPAEFIRLGN
ncbi:PIN domain-containing protein [Candidatus Collierbacteria bacterium]|nr:PIN domain-containing protein [Candidatus Collierbacteria bacterium]